MLITKLFAADITDVPRQWIFEYYLNLKEKLTGQSIKVLSPFNAKDKIPSLSIFTIDGTVDAYRFNDFSSSNKSGDGIELVMKLFNIKTRGESVFKIITDYNEWSLTNDEDYKARTNSVYKKYKVSSYTTRSWTTYDQKYWTKFHIGSRLLSKFNVLPLECYKLTKEGLKDELLIKGNSNIYGFFRSDKTLYKIYQPLIATNKFMKVKDYIQGSDQLTFTKKYLVICSSLKDIMAFTKLGYEEAEAIAPDSENTIISASVISSYALKYQNICTLFDNDAPGIQAMESYYSIYNIKSAILPLSKDLSDSVRDHGILKVKQILTPILKQALQ